MCQYGVFRRNLTNICIYKEKQRRTRALLGIVLRPQKCERSAQLEKVIMRMECRIVIKMRRAQE